MDLLSCRLKLLYNVTMFKYVKYINIHINIVKISNTLLFKFAKNCLIICVGYLRWNGMDEESCIVCSRFLSCSMVICRVHVVITVEHVLSHYCSMCYMSTVVAPLVVLLWWLKRGGYCFASFYVLSMFFYCAVLRRLLEYCLVVWLLGDVVLGRDGGTELNYCVRKCPILDHMMNQLNSVYALTSYLIQNSSPKLKLGGGQAYDRSGY
jgi:hypothetical protein